MAKATSKTVRTTRIEVVDDKGRVRITLGLLGEGRGDVYGVSLSDEHGNGRAWMVQDGLSAEFGLDYAGETIAALVVTDDGKAKLRLAE